LTELEKLRRAALSIYEAALRRADAGAALRRAVRLDGARLRVFDDEFDLARRPRVYSVAVGKAARAMASALEDVLGENFARGVLSAPPGAHLLSSRWEVYEGGHPLPDEESLAAGRAALRLVGEADRDDALLLFLVSGGGSAMLECARDAALTLDDLREANRLLVGCGANIAEVNAVRRALSAIKGGGLSARAPRAAQLTLVVSDVNAGRESDVASGPTLPPPRDAPEALRVVERHGLLARLPTSVLRALENFAADRTRAASPHSHRHYLLLDNGSALESAARAARAEGFAVETASDLVEQDVAEGSAALASRLLELYEREGTRTRGVCLVSGGEFACPVRGAGAGGRSSETALRLALEFERLSAAQSDDGTRPAGFAVLCAGTDGIDGNSPAAGALADHTTLTRARALGLDAHASLDASDSYTFFNSLGDAVVTWPTGTNVRDLRILLAG
jgi:glycerate 2-kinase